MTIARDYEDTVAWLERLYHRPHRATPLVGLERVHLLLDRLGNPQRSFRTVHIAGTTGKGSTTTMVGEILRATGARTGVFRSPHLESYLERISVDGKDVPEAAWIACFNEVAEIAEGMERGDYAGYQWGRPTLFEVLFAMMALHFSQSGVEWAAVETGLGGRLDATNTLQSDVAVVTNVSLEHTKVLGDTVGAIAAEKAAIIKAGCAAVTGAADPAALHVIEERARSHHVPLYRVGREILWHVRSRTLGGQALRFSHGESVLEVELPMPAHFQAVNAATAYAAAVALSERGVDVRREHIADGLSAARVPGRFEVLSRRPLVLVDGAHNPAGMRELRIALDDLAPEGKIVLLFAAMSDKDIPGMAEAFGDRASTVVLTRAPGTERAAEPEALAQVFAGRAREIIVAPEAEDGLRSARDRLTEGDMLVIAGSLYLAGWARSALLLPAGAAR